LRVRSESGFSFREGSETATFSEYLTITFTFRTCDLTGHTSAGEFLEGTGSIVFDHVHRIAYACLSERTSITVLDKVVNLLGYEKCIFEATDDQGRAVYHTNVVMSVCTAFVMIAADALTGNPQLRRQLETSSRKIIELSFDQIQSFAANCFEVENRDGARRMLVMSTRGWNSLNQSQRSVIQASCTVISSPIPTIENVGGGGIRCMLAGIYPPPIQT